MLDSLGTALSFGLDAEDLEAEASPFTRADLYAPDDPAAERFLGLLNGWIEMTMVLNELARSMGQRGFLPVRDVTTGRGQAAFRPSRRAGRVDRTVAAISAARRPRGYCGLDRMPKALPWANRYSTRSTRLSPLASA